MRHLKSRFQYMKGMRSQIARNGQKAYDTWAKSYTLFEADSDVEAEDLKIALNDDTESSSSKMKLTFEDELSEATRNTSGNVLAAVNRSFYRIIMGGSADVLVV